MPTNETDPANTVNDSPWLTHEMVMDAIRMTDPSEASETMRSYAIECDRVGAATLASELRGYADARASILGQMPTDRLETTVPTTNPLDDHRQLRAEIIVREWGEEDRYQTVGPFSPYDPDAPDSDACNWLEDTLRRQGDDVVRVWVD